MNSIVSSSTDPTNPSTEVAVVPARQWSTEPDGPNDRPVDIWNPATGNWVPAFFKDIRKGDFYLILNVNLEPDKCFLAASDCQRTVPQSRWSFKEEPPTFIIRNGSEIVQAPTIKDINPLQIEAIKCLHLPQPT